ncbi:putative coatomer subunit epsilon [Cytospora mali]|uniref:Coatomer subunit epsilon n=1 Tax=Cytospora mali TaxID=578113 RepID=A0A194W9A5_CYTMA|nr:putative coatomer subunit epsilon [Valsa mali]
MDPYSSEGELINIHAAFHQYQYQSVLDDFDPESFSAENHLPARILQLRARVALGQAQDVLDEVVGDKQPELAAVAALADLHLGNAEAAAQAVETLLAEGGDAAGENAIVQVLGGTVLAAAGKADEALALLGRHQGSLDAVALIVQIHLQQNRNDLALKEVASARRWAQDSILVNLAESWVGLRQGGEKYQQAFYVFEELAQAPSTSSVQTLVAQAVAELHLGRTEEAQSALDQALKKDPNYTEAIANSLVLQAIIGKDTTELKETLKKTAPQHEFLTDLEEKSNLFDTAAAKFSAKVAA